MNKKFRIFVKIIYYVFTFGLGIVLALVLPGIYMYGFIAEDMNDSLFRGEHVKSMNLIGGYYDSEPVFLSEDFNEHTGIVIFRAATLTDTKEDDKTNANPKQMNCVYAGFIYGVKRDLYQYEFSDKSKENKSAIYAYNENEKIKIEILNYDTNEDDVDDSINTLENYDYIYFEISSSEINQITALELVNNKGEVFGSKIAFSTPLTFENQFFDLTGNFALEYNKDNSSSKLSALEENVLSVESYRKGDYGDTQTRATKRACIVVLIYFICIYILADFLVGKHYIIKFSIFLFHKIKKKKKDGEETESNNEVYGTDYFTKLTIRLVCEDEIVGNINLHYHNENEEINMIFTKENKYSVTSRVHAGTYFNGKLECGDYKPVNFNDEINVRSYHMDVEIKLEKIKKGEQE